MRGSPRDAAIGVVTPELASRHGAPIDALRQGGAVTSEYENHRCLGGLGSWKKTPQSELN